MAKKILIPGHTSNTILHPQSDGGLVVQSVANVAPILDRAKELHNTGKTRTGMGDRHVASIPIIVIDGWAKKIGKTYQDVMQDAKLFDRFLQDPDNGHFIIDKASV